MNRNKNWLFMPVLAAAMLVGRAEEFRSCPEPVLYATGGVTRAEPQEVAFERGGRLCRRAIGAGEIVCETMTGD